MAIKLLPGKEQIPLFITLATVIILGLGYFYVYLPDSEENLQKWKFRTLHNIDKNIHEKIENGDKLLATYLDNKLLAKGEINKLNDDIQKIRTDSFPIGKIRPFTDKTQLSSVSINDEKQIVLTHTKISKLNTPLFHLSLTYDFERFIKPILPEEVFDNYIIIGKSGVLYETFSTGLDNSSDTLIQKPQHISSSTLTEREFGGIKYKLFIQPVNCKNNTRIIVIGLVTLEHYQNARSKLPPALVLLLILIFTAIIVTFPIIKIYQLRSEDRLTAADALSCTVVSMILVSLLFFSFMKFNSIHLLISGDDPKEKLADAISDSLTKEIKIYSENLFSIDHIMIKNEDVQKTIFNVGKNSPFDSDSNKIERGYDQIKSQVNNILLDRIFWMDSTGQELITWKSDNKKVHFPGKFNTRAYFRNVIRDQGYDLDGKLTQKIYLDQVISWVSGQFLSDISTESSFSKFKAKVLVLSFTAKSVDQIKIPPGYLFAVIDQTGKVLYHSNKSKNLNENLFQELSNPKGLLTSIKTSSPDAFNTSYFGHEYAVSVKATKGGLPYYIVIFDDLRFEESRDIDVHSFTFSMQLLLLVLILLQMLLIFFASARPSSFKVQRFDTRWLSPKKSHHQEYIIATFFNVWIFLVLVFSYIFLHSIISRLFTLLFAITILPVFINLLYFKKNQSKLVKLKQNSKFWPVLISSIIPSIIFILSLIFLKESTQDFFRFNFISIIVPILVFFFIYQSENKINPPSSNYNVSFSGFVFSWMIVANGLPVVFFFTSAFNYDQHLIARYKQLELARKTIQDVDRLDGDRIEKDKGIMKSALLKSDTAALSKRFYRDTYWIKDARVLKGPLPAPPGEDDMAINILNSFHVYDANTGVYNRDLNKIQAFDLSFFFNNLMKQVNEQSDVTETYYRLNKDGQYLQILSSNLNLKLPSLLNIGGIFSWVFFCLLLLALFLVVKGMIYKLFSLNLPITEDWEHFDHQLIKNGNQYTFLINLSETDINTYLTKISKIDPTTNGTTYEMDMALIQGKGQKSTPYASWNAQLIEASKRKYELVFIKHFEYNFRDPYTTGIKLLALEKLINIGGNKHIVIASKIRPATLINVMHEPDAQKLDKHSIERWQYLMSNFKIVIHSLIHDDPLNSPGLLEDPLKEDSLTFKEQTSNYHFYYSIWQSLSREEKFLLYDLAEDGLVNSYDKNTICILINKGIIVPDDGAIRLFSKAFRNFVLTGIGEIETAKIMEKVNDNRNWNKIKMPLALVSLTIAAFILSSQHETSTKLITTLGTLAALVPTLINFLATLSGNSAAKKA